MLEAAPPTSVFPPSIGARLATHLNTMPGFTKAEALSLATQANFYMYSGPAFPSPDALLACRALRRLAPLEEPMAQFYSEIGLYRSLVNHPRRVTNPAQAELFYVPVLPHVSAARHSPSESALRDAFSLTHFFMTLSLAQASWTPTLVVATAQGTVRAWPRLLPCCAPLHTGNGATAPTTCGHARAS